jgi:hypothetical protein
MFLRRKNKTVRGVGYSYWHLCETVRTARGPRQRVVASLGKLDGSDAANWRDQWDDLPALLRGEDPEPIARTAPLPGLESGEASSPKWEQADLRALRVERSRDFGDCYMALSLWHRLGLDSLLAELLPKGREDVEWGQMAALLTVARFGALQDDRAPDGAQVRSGRARLGNGPGSARPT